MAIPSTGSVRPGAKPTPVYERDALKPGQTVEGPAIIDAPDSTMLVHPGQSARMDEHRNITLTL